MSAAFLTSVRRLSAAKDGTLDVLAEDRHLDVERHFGGVMAHVRGASKEQPSEATQTALREKRAKELVTSQDFDGIPRNPKAASTNLFEHGGIEVRPSRRGRRGELGSRRDSSADAHRDADRDVLQLDAAVASKHGAAVAMSSRKEKDVLGGVAPHADITLDAAATGLESHAEAAKKASAVADMLRERLMDLKAEKITSSRMKTHLPKRLNFLSDEEIAERQVESRGTSPKVLLGEDTSSIRPKVRHTVEDVLSLGESKALALENLLGVKSEKKGDMEERKHAAASVLSEDLLPGGGRLLNSASVSHSSNRHDNLEASESVGRLFLLRAVQRAGLVTRRRAIEIVTQGLVKVDGSVESNPFRIVKPENSIFVQGNPGRLRFAPTRLWMYHKPSNVVVSSKDPLGRQLFNKHTAILGMDHLIPAGHLPTKAHGLMLLTNDGELADYINSPRTGLQQTYHLRVRPAIDVVLAQRINERGIMNNGIRHDNITVTVNPAASSRFSVKVQIHGSKLAMPISHIMQHLGRTIERGGRFSLGPFVLSGLAVGSLREVRLPKRFQEHVGRCWEPFIDKDFPFFRRERVLKLRRLSNFRELSKSEVAELNSSTYEELRSALSFDSRELSREAAEMQARIRDRPAVEEPDLPTSEQSATLMNARKRIGEDDYNGNHFGEVAQNVDAERDNDAGIFLDPVALADGDDFVRDVSRAR